MALTTDEVQKLVDKARKVEEEQTVIKTKLDTVKAEIERERTKLKDEFDVTPEELPAEIEKCEAELLALAKEYGLQ
jgi:hypothetical protein